jgi:phosphatidylserine/phosphatidylglycerophosphate/cardiolipin synthase-like enzyme
MNKLGLAAILALAMSVPSGLGSTATPEFGEPSLLIWAFCPATPDGGEYVVIANPTSDEVEGKRRLSDGEGSFAFSADIAPGGRLFLQRGNVSKWERVSAQDVVLDIDSLGPGKFRLSDSGDKIELLSTFGDLLDAVVYEDGEGSSGWSGDPVPFLGPGFAPGRKDATGSDTIEDWDYLRRVKAADMQWVEASEVSAFVIPDAGYERLSAFVRNATRTLDVNSYTLSGRTNYQLLASALARGVRLRVMTDDAPVTGIDNDSLSLLSALRDLGAEVRLSGPFYRYDHAKYMLSDGSMALVSTDNVGLSSFEPAARCCNRGMGVVVNDANVASTLSSVFESDWALAKPYEPKLRGNLSEPIDGKYQPRYSRTVSASDVKAALYITPEMGVSPLVSILGSAKRSIVAWLSDSETTAMVRHQNWTNPMLYTLALASKRGVQVRVIAEQRDVEMLRVWFDALDPNVEVRTLSNGLKVHAKTAIIDDEVSIVSSMNWVFNSMYKNREIGMVVKDRTISSFFAGAFERDWSGDAGDPIARISIPERASIGEEVLVSGTSSVDDEAVVGFSWAIDGIEVSGMLEFNFTFDSPGNHTIRLTVADAAGNSNTTVRCILIWEQSHDQNVGSVSPHWGFCILLFAIGSGLSRIAKRKTLKRLKLG